MLIAFPLCLPCRSMCNSISRVMPSKCFLCFVPFLGIRDPPPSTTSLRSFSHDCNFAFCKHILSGTNAKKIYCVIFISLFFHRPKLTSGNISFVIDSTIDGLLKSLTFEDPRLNLLPILTIITNSVVNIQPIDQTNNQPRFPFNSSSLYRTHITHGS